MQTGSPGVGGGGRDYESTVQLSELVGSEWYAYNGGWRVVTKRGEEYYVGPRQYEKLIKSQALSLLRVDDHYKLSLRRDVIGFTRTVDGRKYIFRVATRDYSIIDIDELKGEINDALSREGFALDATRSFDNYEWGARYVYQLWLGVERPMKAVNSIVRAGLEWRIGDDGLTSFRAAMLWLILKCQNGLVDMRARAYHIGTLVKERIQWLIRDLIERLTPLNVLEDEARRLIGIELPRVPVDELVRRYGRFGKAIEERLSIEAGDYGWNAYALLQALAYVYTHPPVRGILNRIESMDYVGREIEKLREDPEEYVAKLAKDS